MNEKKWWEQPMRVMQFNLQVKDTPLMNPAAIAQETQELCSNVVVMNVGGIYAWYNSKVNYHHINEYLPKDGDLLRDLITQFHKRNIKFVARFDFSITDDTTYLEKPQWFARHKDKTPYYRGEKRMGNWSLYLNTCALGGYRNEEVAVPVINEVLNEYDIDGIFFNAPHASACFCERCQAKYAKLYGKPMPDTPEEFEASWLSDCMKENIAHIYHTIKANRPEVPMILYYAPYTTFSKSFGRCDRDSIYDRYETADLICTESQNVLSRGVRDIPETIHPIVAMKAGQTEDREKLPFGIIHSCPGMDWRHVGLPIAEYLPWMCQVPASGGVLWHSVTGFPHTITDKRIMDAITCVDRWIAKSEWDMFGAVSKAEVLLLWDGTEAARGWAELLVKNHIQFDLMHDYRMSAERMKKYRAVIVPEGFVREEPAASSPPTGSVKIMDMLKQYAADGGCLLAENMDAKSLAENREFYGIDGEVSVGENLRASYLRFEEAGAPLGEGMETELIEFGGAVAYCTPNKNSRILATLVPPFAPYEVVGAPPERASLPVSKTDIPLVLFHMFGNGKVLLLPFSLNQLILRYHLADHYQFGKNAIDLLLGGQWELEVMAPHGVLVTMYEKDRQILVHFVNEVGERPLLDNVPVYHIAFDIALKEGQMVKGVRSVIGEEPVSYEEKNGRVFVSLEKLKVWDMISIDLQ